MNYLNSFYDKFPSLVGKTTVVDVRNDLENIERKFRDAFFKLQREVHENCLDRRKTIRSISACEEELWHTMVALAKGKFDEPELQCHKEASNVIRMIIEEVTR